MTETARASALRGASIDDHEAVAIKAISLPLFPRQAIPSARRPRGGGHREQITARRLLGQGDRDRLAVQYRAGQRALLGSVPGQPDHGRAEQADRVRDGDGQIAPSDHAQQRAHVLEAPEFAAQLARHVVPVELRPQQRTERAVRTPHCLVVLGASRVGRLPARDARIAELTIEPLCAPESIHGLCPDEESKSGLGTVVDGLFHARRDEFSDWLVASLTGERAPHDSAMAVGSNECRYPTIAMISAAAPIAMSANAIPNKRGRFCTADSRLAA